MPGRKKLILVASEAMSNNGKEDRNENSLVRMSKKARTSMGYGEDKVELWSAGDTQGRMKTAMLLDIFHAFKGDIKKVKEMIAKGELKPDDINRVGFVTKQTYKKITGTAPSTTSSIWISNRIDDTVVGCDPEFLLYDKNGRIIKANAVSGFNKQGLVGYDGPAAELRPDPAISVIELVNNMQKILSNKDLVKAIEKYDWHSGCYHRDDSREYQLGGHIHIGNPIQIARLTKADRNKFFVVLNKILDELLAIPLIRIDGEAGRARRTKGSYGSYGYFGEFRTDLGRLENRTLSGLWLTHPELSKMVLGTAKTIIDEVFRLISENKFNKKFMSLPDDKDPWQVCRNTYNGWKDIPLSKEMRCIRSSSDMRSILNDAKAQTINKAFVTKWYNTLKSFSTYKENSAFVDGLAEVLGAPMKTIKSMETNLKKNWLEGKKFSIG
jgi:hypothetical protein